MGKLIAYFIGFVILVGLINGAIQFFGWWLLLLPAVICVTVITRRVIKHRRTRLLLLRTRIAQLEAELGLTD